jgi:hypothetical protein
MLVGGLLAAAYSFRFLERLVAEAPDDAPPARAPAAMQLSALSLALGAFVLGTVPWLPLRLLGAGGSLGGLLP